MPLGAPEEGWRLPKRLRQLESMAGRGLLLGASSKPVASAAAAHCVTLAARRAGEAVWHLVYRSEAAPSCNPEWRPLAWSEEALIAEDGLLDSGGQEVELLLALHALDPALLENDWQQQLAGQGQQPFVCRQPGEQRGHDGSRSGAGAADASWPLLPASTDRPEFELPDEESSNAAGSASHLADDGLGNHTAPTAAETWQAEPDSISAAHGTESRQGSAVEEQQNSGPASLVVQQEGKQAEAESAELGAGSDRSQQSRQPAKQPGQSDVEAVFGHAMAPSGPANGSLAFAASPDPAAVLAGAAGAVEPAGTAGSGRQGWLASLAAALAGTGCCPGRLVAAWQLRSLEELFPAGADLTALQRPLLPNTLVLQFGDGQYLCPPPPALQAQASGSTLQHTLQNSAGTSGAATQGEEVTAAAAPASPVRRGFARLLVSKLLRSNHNLQEAGSLQGSGADLSAEGGLSDAESDAGSDATAATGLSRSITAALPAAGELPSGAGSRAGSAAAAAAAAAAALPASVPRAAPGTAGARMLTLAGVQQCITSLASLQSRLRDLAGRSQALQAALAARMEPQRQRQQQQAALAALAGEAARCRQRESEVQQQLAEVQAATAAVSKQATVRAQALVTTLKVMQAAGRRVGEAEASLQGEAGRGALVGVLRELVAQRCQMVSQLGAIFQLGPTQVSIPEAPPGGFLEDRLEQQWAGAASFSLTATPSRQLGGGGAMPGFGGGGSAVDSPSKYRQEMRLSIGGLEIRPWVWRKAFEEGGGYDSDAAEDRAAGVALGYVAQVAERLGSYLGVVLRYPLVLRGSRSAVVDCQPPAGMWAEGQDDVSGDGTRRPFLAPLGPGPGSAAGAAGERGVEYPLYCDSNRERPRFAVGVFLLNKDVIQLLQAHGISAAGPNHLLQNLYKLLLAAQSALPHLPPVLGASAALQR